MAINTFSPNTKIKSSDINANFQGIVNGSELRSLTNNLKFASTGVGVNGVDTVGTELNMWNWNGTNRLEGGSNTRGMTILASGINLTNQYRAWVSKSGAQSISNGVVTTLTWDTESFDVGALHSTSVNTDRLTIPTGADGVYLATLYVNFATNATGQRAAYIYINGSSVISMNVRDAVSGFDPDGVQVSVLYNLVATDYIQARCYQSSSGSLNVQSAGSYFSIMKVA